MCIWIHCILPIVIITNIVVNGRAEQTSGLHFKESNAYWLIISLSSYARDKQNQTLASQEEFLLDDNHRRGGTGLSHVGLVHRR